MNPRLAQQLVNAKEKRKHHLRVPVLQEERQIIERQASRVDRPLLAFTLTEPDVRISRIRLFRAGHPD